MNLDCQISAVEQLEMLAKARRHSVLIEGPEGCGKTALAAQYSKMLNVNDFTLISPNVQQLRDAIDSCYNISTDTAICIENLDLGVAGASYTILKFLEEPADNVYIIVTCRNRYRIPDTIISRSTVISVNPPTFESLLQYCKSRYPEFDLSQHPLNRCVKTFSDVDQITKMSADQVDYFHTFNHLDFSDSVSNMVWKLSHYSDNSECPVKFAIRYIMNLTHNVHVHRCGVECLDDISTGRIASHAAVTKFCMDLKYTE